MEVFVVHFWRHCRGLCSGVGRGDPRDQERHRDARSKARRRRVEGRRDTGSPDGTKARRLVGARAPARRVQPSGRTIPPRLRMRANASTALRRSLAKIPFPGRPEQKAAVAQARTELHEARSSGEHRKPRPRQIRETSSGRGRAAGSGAPGPDSRPPERELGNRIHREEGAENGARRTDDHERGAEGHGRGPAPSHIARSPRATGRRRRRGATGGAGGRLRRRRGQDGRVPLAMADRERHRNRSASGQHVAHCARAALAARSPVASPLRRNRRGR